MSYDIGSSHENGSHEARDHECHPGRGRHGRHRPERQGLLSGRKISSGDLQLILLALLEKRDSHGYELIKSLEELSDGFYVPSPGMIYPSLTYLEEVGYATLEVDGAKKLYHLTEAGRAVLGERRERAQQILDDLARIGARMEQARRALSEEEGPGRPGDEFREVRNDLRSFLRGFWLAEPDDEARVVKVLRNAVAELRGEDVPIEPDALMRAIAGRRSMGLSRLSPEPVDQRLIERMLEAANWAPSHEDTEPWRFTVFIGDGRERLASIFAEATDVDGARKRAFAAPVWIAIGMSPMLQEDGSPLMSLDEEIMAVACAVQNLHLMAQASGLAGMWHSKGTSVNLAVARGLGLEPPSRLLGFFMCGRPAGEWLTSSRRPLAEKVTWHA